MSNIGFIGLGNMGFPMAQNLAKEKQHNIYVFDLNIETLKKSFFLVLSSFKFHLAISLQAATIPALQSATVMS